MTRRSLALAVGAWIVVVALGAGVAWAVISRTGEGLVVGTRPTVDLGTPAATDPSSTATRSGKPKPSRSPTKKPSSPSSPSSAGTPDSSTPAQPTSPSSSTSAPAPPPQPVAKRGTWEGAAGYVIAECRGATVSLVGAQPNSGYELEVESTGPVRLRAEFEGRGEDERKTRVEADCLNGVPRFSVGFHE